MVPDPDGDPQGADPVIHRRAVHMAAALPVVLRSVYHHDRFHGHHGGRVVRVYVYLPEGHFLRHREDDQTFRRAGGGATRWSCPSAWPFRRQSTPTTRSRPSRSAEPISPTMV